jgi:transketolase
LTPGVDATAGPLGQGIAQAVGMAVAEEAVAASYPGWQERDEPLHYCLCGDGCLEEGISQEAISFAGHQKLNKLILIYDANTSTLDGPTSNTMSEDVKERFLSAEWNVLEVKDGNDIDQIDKAIISKAKESPCYPSLIIVHTLIGFGSVNQGSAQDPWRAARRRRWPMPRRSMATIIPNSRCRKKSMTNSRKPLPNAGKKAYADWQNRFCSIPEQSSEGEQSLHRCFRPERRRLSSEDADLRSVDREATRNSSGHIVSALPSVMPFTLGGSADVAGS